MPDREKILVILASVVVAAAVIGSLVLYLQIRPKVPPEQQLAVVSEAPPRTDYGSTTPPDFPSDIPLEQGSAVSQSYGLDYQNQKQLTMVFSSAKSVKDNYTLYSGFLSGQGWNIESTFEDTQLSAVYATRGANDINITIARDPSMLATSTDRSQVSISILKKS
jgi:hypothetical protein